MMKIILTLLTFFLNHSYAIELNEGEVVLPLGLSQLDKTILVKGENEIRYKITYYRNTNQDMIQARPSSSETLDGFMSNLIYSYISQDKNAFKSLLSKESSKSLDVGSEKFTFSFNFLKKIKKPYVRYAYEYLDGYIISWSAIGLITDRLIYLKKVKKEFKMFNLAVPKDDHLFWNVGLYFKFAPFKSYTPIQPKLENKATKVKLKIPVHKFRNWIYIYNPANKRQMIAVSDNYPNNKQYKDYDFNSKSIELKIDKNELKKIGDKIHIIETSFQLEGIPSYLNKKAITLDL